MLVLSAEQGLALARKRGGVRWLGGGVGVWVQRQNPSLGQQRPPQAEQQQQGKTRPKGVHSTKMKGNDKKTFYDNENNRCSVRMGRLAIIQKLYIIFALLILCVLTSVIISTIPDFSLQYDEQLSLLRVEWASGADMRGLRTSTEALFRLCRKLGTRHWLLNMDTFPDISVYDQIWLGANWVPTVLHLPLARVVLVIHRRRVHNQLAIDAILAVARPFIHFDIQYFPRPEAGMQWLSDYSDRIPALLAEWEALHGPDLPAAPSGADQPRKLNGL